MGGAAVALAAPSLADPTVPAAAITNDPNASNGTLAFYGASGNVLTSGSNLQHLFDYAAASTPATRTGITKATIYFAFPDHTQTDSQNWFNYQATTAATFPNASNPAPLNSSANPVAHAAANEADLSDSLPTTTQDQTTGYKGILQIRLYDTGPGKGTTTNFWATDIYYDATAGTWQQVFPAAAQATTTTLAASPQGGAAPNATVTLTATMTPSAAAGTVQFLDGATDIGTPVAVTNGVASTTTSWASNGTHQLSAVFTPTDTSSYTGSTSSTVNYVTANVPGAPTGVSATAGHASATVKWAAPADSGGSAITGYDIEYKPATAATFQHVSAGAGTSKVVTGLTNGTKYVFQVAAKNVIGTGAYSTPTGQIAPFADNSSLAISKALTIAYGKATTITGTLTDTSTHKAVSGATLTLYHRATTSGAWIKGASAKTGSTGVAKLSAKPTSRTYYQWRYAGTTVVKAATSGTDTVNLSQVVGITAPAKVTHGKAFTIWGTVSPGTSGQKVELQRKVGTSYRNVVGATLKRQKLPNGATKLGYVFKLTLKTKGSYSYRVTRAATSTLSAGTSAGKTVRVV
jgi:hypothetical protein